MLGSFGIVILGFIGGREEFYFGFAFREERVVVYFIVKVGLF